MQKKINGILKRKFIKNVLIVASGAAMAQIITLFLLPIVTRLYGPEAYGLMGTFLAIVSIVVPIAGLSYSIAIVLPKEDDEAKVVIKLSLIVTFIIASLSLVFLLLFYKPISTLMQVKEISKYLFLTPLVILAGGYFEVLKEWMIRKNEYKIVSKVTVYQPIIANSSMIFIGLLYPVASVLIIISSIKQGISAFLLYLSFKKKYKNFSNVNSKFSLKETAIKYIDFPLYRAPEGFINAIAQSMPIFILATLFGPSAAGFFTLCRSVLTQPISLVGSAVGEVFYPRISKAYNDNEKLTNLLKKVTFVLGVVGVLPFGVVVITGPWLFELVFGLEWRMGGDFARWLSVEFYFLLMSRPAVKVLPVLSAQRFNLLFTTIMLFLKASALFIGFYIFEDQVVAVALLAIIGAIMYFYLIFKTLSICKKWDIVNAKLD